MLPPAISWSPRKLPNIFKRCYFLVSVISTKETGGQGDLVFFRTLSHPSLSTIYIARRAVFAWALFLWNVFSNFKQFIFTSLEKQKCLRLKMVWFSLTGSLRGGLTLPSSPAGFATPGASEVREVQVEQPQWSKQVCDERTWFLSSGRWQSDMEENESTQINTTQGWLQRVIWDYVWLYGELIFCEMFFFLWEISWFTFPLYLCFCSYWAF